ncbi:hypothetical protein V8C42DRAFT_10269 [Trichoderma barbatum]
MTSFISSPRAVCHVFFSLHVLAVFLLNLWSCITTYLDRWQIKNALFGIWGVWVGLYYRQGGAVRLWDQADEANCFGISSRLLENVMCACVWLLRCKLGGKGSVLAWE